MINITLSFFIPIICIFNGPSITAIMSMPKATVNKNRYFTIQKNEVWMTFDIVLSPPACNMVGGKVLYQHKLCTFVPR